MTLYDLLCGIAVGDAVGNPLEFKKPVTLTDVIESFAAPVLRVSDDTQMTLFLAEGIATWHSKGTAFRDEIAKSYLRWYITQGGASMSMDGLLKYKSMYNVEAPGNTCMESLLYLREGIPVSNDSKGNGTVMRCAPIALYCLQTGKSKHEAMQLAHEDAYLTHKHETASVCSKLLVVMLMYLMEGGSRPQSIIDAIDFVGRNPVPLPVMQLIASVTTRPPHHVPGWVAEEALYAAVSALVNNHTYEDVITQAIRMSDDSDTAASIAGGLAVAAGMKPSERHINKLNVRDAMKYVCDLTPW